MGGIRPLIVFAIAWLLAASAQAAKPDARLLAAVKSCDAGSRALLERVVAVDSGTGDAEGLRAVGALYAQALHGLDATVASVAPTPPSLGDNVVATFTGRGRGRIVLIAHLDTVFSRGDVARRKPHWDGDHYVGPGAGDDKNGGVTALCALQALKAVGFRDFARIDLILNASEETGSPGARQLIAERVRDADVAVVLERGVPIDGVVVGRKGSGTLTMEFAGRAAHSGLEPEKGRNAALEAARVALELGKLADPQRGTTVTVDILQAGEKTNVVPDRAILKADVRAFTDAEFDRVEQAAARIAASPGIDGVTIHSALARTFPAWPHAPSTDALLARANRLYAELGRTLHPVEVGSSGDVALAGHTGTPSIDGFGMEGGGAHGADDYVDLATLTPRAYVLARLIMDVGRDPPGR